MKNLELGHEYPDNGSWYSSAYTMYFPDGRVEMYQDDLLFATSEPHGVRTNVIAQSMVDRYRTQTQLIMRSNAGYIAGKWVEVDADSGAILTDGDEDASGFVEFKPAGDGRYYGCWSRSYLRGYMGADGGTWVLTPHEVSNL